jgi:CDP-glycerol glycerophosphotransferase (TagB/SpsB family)
MFGVDFYDAILLPNEFLIPELREIESLRGIPEKEVAVVGSTYMDGLKKQKDNSTLKTRKGNKNTTVLVAPSWGPSSILNRYGRTFLQALVETGFDIIVRPHPQSYTSDPQLLADLRNEFREGEHFSWNTDNDNFNVLSRSDIMISDFSGVIFDFVFTFGRPVIYADTNLDLSIYDDCWLSKKAWRLEIISELGRKLEEKDFPDLKSIITDCISDDSFKKKREKIIKEAWSCQGEAAEKVVDYLMNIKTAGC